MGNKKLGFGRFTLTACGLLGLAILLPACSQDNSAPLQAQADTKEAQTAAPVKSSSALPQFSEQQLRADIKTLASDDFEGRQPGSAGEQKTIDFLSRSFEEIGVKPANNGSYLQKVDLVEITTKPGSQMNLVSASTEQTLDYGQQMMAWSKRITDKVSVKDSDVVFVGYGIVAPEYQWNDYEGVDVKGKTVVVLVNDPGYATQNDELFNGNAMTYYGRWTYKYEEAARQGAAAAIIIHETKAAAYPWAVVTGSWSGPQFDLVTEDKNMSRAKVEAWITTEAAQQLFSNAGVDYNKTLLAAQKPGFKAIPLDTSMSMSLESDSKISTSHNVAALISGSDGSKETVVYTAHWDHLGMRQKNDNEDHTFNGAVDNATGTAALLELARAFKAKATAPKRNILFLAVTAEESGLLGSKHYAQNPLIPLADTIAAINMDAANVFGPTHDVSVVGFGASDLETYLTAGAKLQGRVVQAEANPEKGGFYRSDHFNFSKVGVPALYAASGTNHRDKPEGWGAKQRAQFTADHYHKASDEYHESWDLGGMLEDMQLYYYVGDQLANNGAYPNWFEGNEFRAARDASRKDR